MICVICDQDITAVDNEMSPGDVYYRATHTYTVISYIVVSVNYFPVALHEILFGPIYLRFVVCPIKYYVHTCFRFA